jgi:hypothetical protein
MAQDDLLNQIKAAIRQHAAQQPDMDVGKLLRRVEDLFDQHGSGRDPNVPDLAGIAIGRELDDYDHERPDSEDTEGEEQDMEAGTLTELGARTASPFGGSVAHAGEGRYGGARPAGLGPYGSPVEEREARERRDQQLGDPTDLGDRQFANRSADRQDPQDSLQDSEDVGET